MFSFGLYRKQLLLFLGIALLFVFLGWVISQQQSEASGRPITLPASEERPVVTLDLADHGLARVFGTTVANTVTFGPSTDEFRYLLLTDLPRPIQELTVRVTFPRPVDPATARPNALIIYSPDSRWTGAWLDETTYQYTVLGLDAGSSLTLASRLPKGVILPSFVQSLVGTVLGWPHLVWLAVTLVGALGAFALGLVVLVASRPRDRSHEILSQLPDLGLSPAEVTGLVDGRISIRAIAATILDLARRGYLEIGHRLNAYTFTKRKKAFDQASLQALNRHEQILLDKLFAEGRAQSTAADVRIRIGEELFSQEVAEFYVVLYERLARAGFFNQSPSIVQGSYRLAGLAIFFGSLFGFLIGAMFFNQHILPLITWVVSLGSGLLVVARAPHLSPYTAHGHRARLAWLSFKNYLTDHQALDWRAVNQQVYLDLLPYAIALGVETAWSARFLEAPFQIPDWYHGDLIQGEVDGFTNDLFPMIGFLARELAATKDPRLS